MLSFHTDKEGKRIDLMQIDTQTDRLQRPVWYALQTRSRHEKVVRDHLIAKAITAFLPLRRIYSARKDRVKIIEVPLFSGYLFTYFALTSYRGRG